MGARSLAWRAAPHGRAASCTWTIRRRQCRCPHDGADSRRQERLRAKYDRDDRGGRLAAAGAAAVGDGGAKTRLRFRRHNRRHGHLAQRRADARIGQVHPRPSGRQRRRSGRCAAAARIGHTRRLDIEDGHDSSSGRCARRRRCAESGGGDRGDRVRSDGNSGHDGRSSRRDHGRPGGGRASTSGGKVGRECRNRNGSGTGRDNGSRARDDGNRRVASRRAAGRAGDTCAIGTINAVCERADASAAIASRGDRRGVVLSAEPAAARFRCGTSADWRADAAPGGMERIDATTWREHPAGVRAGDGAAIRADDGASRGRRRDGARVFGREPRQVRSGGSGRAHEFAGFARSHSRRGCAPQRVLAVDDGPG